MIVLDCCAAIEIARKTDKGNALRMLMLDMEEIIAPSLFSYEVANTAWKLCAFGQKDKETAMTLTEDALGQIDRFVPAEDCFKEAFSEACRYKHSVYDLFYAVLARRTGATLFTVDKQLVKLCEQMGVSTVAEIDF